MTICIQIGGELERRLKVLAYHLGVSPTRLVRAIIQSFFEAELDKQSHIFPRSFHMHYIVMLAFLHKHGGELSLGFFQRVLIDKIYGDYETFIRFYIRALNEGYLHEYDRVVRVEGKTYRIKMVKLTEKGRQYVEDMFEMTDKGFLITRGESVLSQ